MDQENASPSIQKPIDAEPTLTFSEAIEEATVGKKIHKLEWKDRGYYGFLDGTTLRLHHPDNTIHDWIISEGDLTGDDWIVI